MWFTGTWFSLNLPLNVVQLNRNLRLKDDRNKVQWNRTYSGDVVLLNHICYVNMVRLTHIQVSYNVVQLNLIL
jgi:hypothetical protein